MGRKSVVKDRIQNPAKRRELASQLLPALNGEGISHLTMDEVAKRLGRSKATIYKYFESREELYELALAEKLTEISGFVSFLKDTDQSYEDRYQNALAHLSVSLKDVTANFLGDLREDFATLWEKVSTFQDMASIVLKAFYQEGMDQGIIHPIHPAVLVVSDQVLFNAFLEKSFLEENELTLSEVFENYFQMKFYGLLKEK